MMRAIGTRQRADARVRIDVTVKNVTWLARARIALALCDAAQYLLRPGNRHVDLEMEMRPVEKGEMSA